MMNENKITDIKINIFDEEEIHHNCTVQILRNSLTGEVSIGWWKEGKFETEEEDESVGRMKEYIERDAALKAFEPQCGDWSECWSAEEIKPKLESIPAADVVPVVHAYWIPQKENHEFKEVWMKCSACGYPVSKWTGNTNFCPNCGAKMTEV